MFAGDTNISSAVESLTDLEPVINHELMNLIIGFRQKLDVEGDTEIQAYLDSKPVKRVNHTKSFRPIR